MSTTKTWPVSRKQKEFEAATKLSEILEIAIDDLLATEKLKDVEINMGAWVEPKEAEYDYDKDKYVQENGCIVCMAGSVMRQRYPKVIKELEFSATPHDFSEYDDAENKLNAINSLRCGHVAAAARELGYGEQFMKVRYRDFDRSVAEYEDDRTQFLKDMRRLLKDLKEAGI